MTQPGLKKGHYFPAALMAFVFGTILILFGCATTAHQEPQYVSQPDDIDVIPAETFDLPDLLADNNRRATLDVQVAKAGEMPEVSPKNAIEGASAGLFAWIFVGLPGVLLKAPPGATFTDIVIVAAAGGILFTAGGAVWGEINSNNHSIVSKAFRETDFAAQIQYILDKNLSFHFPGEPDDMTAIKLLILDYGFSTRGADTLEFYCEANIEVRHAGEVVFEDFIFWSAQTRSQDVPPPVSASLGAFAKDEGALMRSMLQESSEVVAAVVLKRLKVSYESGLHSFNICGDQRLSGVQQQPSGSADRREGLAHEL
ncbi:MAG: hypothetical protein JRF72_13640 [Deltaproteobacteria bacterium]|jgi:hypothetical protein|nr:hypothetical protein [Deltaproteobacteria bacterium]